MNAWIYAGIAGIPAAFRSTRDSKREQVRKGVRDALTTDMMDSVSNTFIDLLVRIALSLYWLLSQRHLLLLRIYSSLLVVLGR